LLGGTLDLHAGQFIDRVGVAMGLPFPAGPHLERLAALGKAKSRLPSSVRGLSCHFSGAEAQSMRWLADGTLSREDIAAEVFACVARTVARLVVGGCAGEGLGDALLGGGVASSTLIRSQVTARVAARNRAIRLHFARPDLAGDNAVGVAMIGAERMVNGRIGDAL
jgi:N6-L-threonylcarbamoyladenine synthase